VRPLEPIGNPTFFVISSIAVTAEVPLDRLWHAVPAFPSEIWLELLEAYGL
jgi:hypothetical protein